MRIYFSTPFINVTNTKADNYSKNADTALYFKIMTADDGGIRGFLPKMTSFFTTIFGLIFASLLLNLDKSESKFQKYINHKFS